MITNYFIISGFFWLGADMNVQNQSAQLKAAIEEAKTRQRRIQRTQEDAQRQVDESCAKLGNLYKTLLIRYKDVLENPNKVQGRHNELVISTTCESMVGFSLFL